MTVLALDTETSGLPAPGVALGSPQYPWPTQIGAVLFNMDGHNLAVFHSRIRAEGRTISAGAEAVHGVSTREAGRTGIPEVVALSVICHYAAEARYLTGFNLAFDRDVLLSVLIRLGKDSRKLMRPGLMLVDLMHAATPFCKLDAGRGDGQYKFPKLDDAMSCICNERARQGRHDALSDVLRAKRLFLSLHHRGALDVQEAA